MLIRTMLFATAAMVATPAFASTVYDTGLLDLPSPFLGNATNGAPTGALGTAGKVSSAIGGFGAASVSDSHKDQWIQRNVIGGASVGITNYQARSGNGSAVFASPSGSGKADLEYLFATPVALSGVVGGSYDWFRDVVSNNPAAQAPVYRLILGNASGKALGGGTFLVYEPVYNGVGTAPEGAWQTATFDLSSTFWANNNNVTRAAGVDSCKSGGTCFDSLGDWISLNSSLTVIGIGVGVGSGWDGGFVGAVDNVSYNFGNAGSATFNFEVAGLNAVPEPASWAMLIAGFGLIGFAMRRRTMAPATAA
ncbi:PEPxxWA-CTERM sorting domain-containing protein [Sphingomonas flavalba]|uniref:PEPxxWA-CTERM sorting domain-containing protein n=1 Tax=Sphingomonas flavalba TaxID=2559804 RepID=UPI0039E1FC47